MRIGREKIIVGIVILLAMMAVVASLMVPPDPPYEVVGQISATDQKEFCRVARQELRSLRNPHWDWADIKEIVQNPRILLVQVSRFRTRRILKVEAQADGSVMVLIGEKTIPSFYLVIVKEGGKWKFLYMWV